MKVKWNFWNEKSSTSVVCLTSKPKSGKLEMLNEDDDESNENVSAALYINIK